MLLVLIKKKSVFDKIKLLRAEADLGLLQDPRWSSLRY